MENFAVNPYLPLSEYVPDGEPRLFNGRVYLYGSHDTAGGHFFCLEDYVAWSAPENDLKSWRYEGVIYRKTQDPANADGSLQLFAPDVIKGPDGRYYLFYCLKMLRQFSVAVSTSPAGPFEFYGCVKKKDGTLLSEYMPYDPAVLADDDGNIYLYYGFSSEMLAERFHTEISPGAMAVRIDRDMLTALSEPKVCIPRNIFSRGTSFENHAYFEAPSIRKIRGRYYLIYSSEVCHELCYAVSDRPDEGFSYGGIIVDNADLGFKGRSVPVCIPGNNHGGLVEAAGKLYMFYHRHTHGTSFSRQGCAERVHMLPDGGIEQVEITSSGLNDGPLPAAGTYPASVSCVLYGKNPEQLLDFRNVKLSAIPFITHSGAGEETEQYITNIFDETVIGYRYFDLEKVRGISLTVRGHADGRLSVYTDSPDTAPRSETAFTVSDAGWQDIAVPAELSGVHGLYFRFRGEGNFDFARFTFLK
jgi:arabinoxylan arabinofuranohydrolase